MGIIALGAFFVLSFFGFHFFAIAALAYAFYGTVLKDKTLPKSEHQMLLLGLWGLTAFEVSAFVFTMGDLDNLFYAGLVGAFAYLYTNRNSSLVSKMRKGSKSAAKETEKMKDEIRNTMK